MKKTELIFLPIPAAGHLVSTVEFSKRLLSHNPNLSITILVINAPWSRGVSISLTSPSSTSSRTSLALRIVDLPEVPLPPPDILNASIEHGLSVFIASHRPHVKDAIARLQSSSPGAHFAGLFLDMFCTSIIDVAYELGINSYIFFCSSAAFLGLLLHLPVHSHQVGETRFDESDPDSPIPCFQNPVPARVLPSFTFNKLGYKTFMEHAIRFKETKGIVINTCADLEPHALTSLSKDYDTAPVYPVGPVLDLDSKVHKPCDESERERIIGWLDEQPEFSVVFLCFGSGGYLGEDQVREIAKGLRESGQRFLWSFRKAPVEGAMTPSEYTEEELRIVLDEEFWSVLEEGRGLVCGWAPQVEILGHEGTGAFVSHCGWNSTLESLWFGKPIVAWPMYAEQQLNAFELVRELGIAVELALEYRKKSGGRLVEAGDVEKAVRSVMDEGNPVRGKAREMSEVCRRSLVEGGSSFGCVDRLIKELVGEAESVAMLD